MPVELSKFVRESVRVKEKQVRLFVKPYCSWCRRAEDWLDKHGVDYETIDVIADESAFDEMIRLSNQDLAPVIDVDGEILADFGPDQLAVFWKKLEERNAGTATH